MVGAHRPGHRARVQADAAPRGDRGAAEHDLRHRLRPRDRAQALPRQGARERVRRPAARALSGRRRAVALPALRPNRLVRLLVLAARDPDPVRAARDGARDGLRLGAVRRPRGRADAARDRRRAGAGGAHARCLGLADVLAHHAAVDPLGRHLRRRRDDRALSRRVRRRRRRLGKHLGPDRDRDAPRPGLLREPRPGRAPTASRSRSAGSPFSCSSQ